MHNKRNIVFLYSELAAYFIACVDELAKFPNVEIHVVRWPVNNEAPFHFGEPLPNVHFYDRNNFTLKTLTELMRSIQPDLVYCSGWMDKDYLKLCRMYRKNIPVVGGLDTQWTGQFKQRLRSAISFATVKRYFSHLWVAGNPQRTYAKKLGFSDKQIIDGVYSADLPLFNKVYENINPFKKDEFPHRFIYVGRYLEFKGIYDLWRAFIATFDVQQHDWELWCIGTGALWDKRIEHPSIKHFGFVQPGDMKEYMQQTGVFVLPSHFEPWAVVVHEFAAAGFPLICSDKVGAASQFLTAENGLTFKAGDVFDLRQKMLTCINSSPQQLYAMGQASNRLAQQLSPAIWSQRLLNLL